MFAFDGFGKRLQQLRKEKGLTQEELARRLGVSGQAVSKWENGQSYPDITSIPTIATILGTEINYLFGKKENSITAFEFPPDFDGLPFVFSFQNIACYSSKAVVSADGSGVRFTDGSTAELSTRLVFNRGVGEIRLLKGSDMKQFDWTMTSRDWEFDAADSIDMEMFFAQCEIIRSADGKSRVRAKGDGGFISMLDVRADDQTLTIRFKDRDGYESSERNNRVVVEIPCEPGKRLSVHLGSGSLTSEINHFDTGALTIDGSGTVNTRGFAECGVTINGSGSITGVSAGQATFNINGSGHIVWEHTDSTEISINGSGSLDLSNTTSLSATVNGSGDITLGRINENGGISANINGSGDIRIYGGSCRKFDIDIGGTGNVDATGVTARKASIVLRDCGSVKLGRVLESSSEQILRKGTITILNRGN